MEATKIHAHTKHVQETWLSVEASSPKNSHLNGQQGPRTLAATVKVETKTAVPFDERVPVCAWKQVSANGEQSSSWALLKASACTRTSQISDLLRLERIRASQAPTCIPSSAGPLHFENNHPRLIPALTFAVAVTSARHPPVPQTNQEQDSSGRQKIEAAL